MLSHYDYWVIGFYFAFMLLIGWVCRRFIANTSDYFRGGGEMLWWMVGSSAFMVSFSAWTFTGGASKAYEDGPIIMAIFIGNALGFFLNYLHFAPRFRQMRVVTSMEGIRDRFGPVNEQFFTWLQVPLGVLYAGIWLNGLSVFISAIFHLNLTLTIVGTGLVVLIMSVIGGAWAVVAGDFIQMLILMPVTVVAAVLAISRVGGWSGFVNQLPKHHIELTTGIHGGLLYLWVIAILIKQFISTNNMLEASRYLNVKDTGQARKAGLLGMALFTVGPLVWFIPPMVAAITHPSLKSDFPGLPHPGEASYVAVCMDVMPAGMVGLLVSGIFAATMSSMDAGLNRNAGIFVRNFYHVVLRPRAAESELLFAGKLTTNAFGILVILAAWQFSALKGTRLFDLMLQFGTLVAMPYYIPLIWGMFIRKSPDWAAWSTVLAGFASSLAAKFYFTQQWLERLMGWPASSLTRSEQEYWGIITGVFLNITIGSLWFLGATFLARRIPASTQERVEQFFARIAVPVDFEREMGPSRDTRQYRTLGTLCLLYGGCMTLMLLIPNPPLGRLAIFCCVASILIVGGVLLRKSRRQS